MKTSEPVCAVVGGGAGGLFCAALLAEAHSALTVTLFEANKMTGRKLLLSGSGQCNYTHAGPLDAFLDAYGDPRKGRFLKRALYAFTNEDAVGWFAERGMKSAVREDGKVFPAAFDARAVRDLLFETAVRGGVQVRSGEGVTSVAERPGGPPRFVLRSGTASFEADYVVLATGGKSYPASGSRGDGYRFAEELGHRIIAPRPALAPLQIRDYRFRELAGVSLSAVRLSVLKNGRKFREKTGGLVFTHGGLSGPVVLDLSRYVEPGDTVSLDLSNAPSSEAFLASFPALLRSLPARPLRDLLRELGIPRRLAAAILSSAGVNEDTRCGNLSKKAAQAVGRSIVSLPFTVEKLGGFHVAMTTAGGVDLSEVRSATMESRLVEGLFFAGEVLDIDGDTGGYNIQAAFSTAAAAARTILERCRSRS